MNLLSSTLIRVTAALLVLVGLLPASSTPLSIPLQPVTPNHIDADLWAETVQNGHSDFLVFLNEQADLSAADTLSTKAEKTQYVYRQLTEVAQRTQASLLRWLQEQGAQAKPYWLVNMIEVQGDQSLLQQIATRPEVRRIASNRSFALPSEPISVASVQTINPGAWGIHDIHADQVWSTYGIRGQGIVVSDNDTGSTWNHPALKSHYRGWDGSTVSHDYNWYDAIHDLHDGTNVCGINLKAPCDDFGHGTHTTGTMIGDDGGNNGIGVAPDAKWIACRNMNGGNGTPARYIECFQFVIAPTDTAGNDPRPDLAADVVNNSWTCPMSEGCVTGDELHAGAQAVTAAGIFQADAAGNSGSCNTITDPPSLYPDEFSVGAYDKRGSLAGFSSRGSVTYNGQEYIRPDLSAPGVDVYSSIPSGYTFFSGTSMATPHVAGTVALVWSAVPRLKGNVNLTRQLLRLTARSRTDNSCGPDANAHPNNDWGWGMLDAYAAVTAARGTGILTGVVGGANGQAIPGAIVTVSDGLTTTQQATTNALGIYMLTLATGTYSVAAQNGSSVSDGIHVDVIGTFTVTQNLQLTTVLATPTQTSTSSPTQTATPTATHTPTDTRTPTWTPSATATLRSPQKFTVRLGATQNATLSAYDPTANFAGAVNFRVRQPGVVNGLLQFDLSSIPASATVETATLRLYATEGTNPNPLVLSVYGMRRPWREGNATYLQADLDSPWGTPGASATSDRDPASVASTILTVSPAYTQLDLTGLVQTWVNGTHVNYGVLLSGDGSKNVEYDFIARSWTVPEVTPALIVNYVVQ